MQDGSIKKILRICFVSVAFLEFSFMQDGSIKKILLNDNTAKSGYPNDFSSLKALEESIMDFQHHYEHIAKPFEWDFTRKDLKDY
jgi:hypothetical protein